MNKEKDKLINSMRTKIKYLGRDLEKLKTLEEENKNEKRNKEIKS